MAHTKENEKWKEKKELIECGNSTSVSSPAERNTENDHETQRKRRLEVPVICRVVDSCTGREKLRSGLVGN